MRCQSLLLGGLLQSCLLATCMVGCFDLKVAASESLDYAVIVTGEELLQGAYADSHTQFIARTLLPLGGHCVYSLTVDDRPQDLKNGLGFVVRHAPLVIITGGLGPTANDITRPTLSEFTGIPLREQPELVAEMERRFKVPADKLRSNLRRQCLVPERGTWFDNPHGTAAGLVFEHADYALIALPGPPRELQPMLRNQVVPYLERKYGVRRQRCSVTLRFVGIGQSQIDQTLRDRGIVPPDVTTSTQFEGGRVDFSFSLPENTPSNQAALRELTARVREVFEEHIYAEGTVTLEDRVLELLHARGASLVLVEIASAGRLASNLAQAAGATQTLKGSYVALSEEGLRRLLEIPDACWPSTASAAERLRVIAHRARERTGAQWAIVVGALPVKGGEPTEVPVGLGDATGHWEMQRVPTQGTGELVQANLVTQILAKVRRQIQ